MDKKMSYDISHIEIKPNAELIVSKSGRVYYKSLYNSVKKYNNKNRDKINEISRERYRNNEIYKEQNKLNNRLRYHKKIIDDTINTLNEKSESDESDESDEKKIN